MNELLASVAAKKERLDALRPMSHAALLGLQKFYDVDLTYSSNAIEGNTLTLRETAEVIEHGITVGGKPLRDHLEAVDHYNAVLWVRELAATTAPIDEMAVRELHRRIVFRSQPEIGGVYSSLPRRIAGSAVVCCSVSTREYLSCCTVSLKKRRRLPATSCRSRAVA